MTNVSMTEVSMEKCLLHMPYEILFEIFRELPKGKLIRISKLSSKFEDIAGDTRLWKDVHIKYKPFKKPPHVIYDFEKLYSGPWPVKVIDLSKTKVNPPVSSQIGRVTKVTTLCLTSVRANTITIEAILAKYQCTELILHLSNIVDSRGSWTMPIAPETFLKQTALEVLSLDGQTSAHSDPSDSDTVGRWLRQVLSYCKNLKTLKLSDTLLTGSGMLRLVENLPTSLEKLSIASTYPPDSFFELLAKSSPYLKELELSPEQLECPSLLKFQFLETLHFPTCPFENYINYLHKYLTKFPALKIVHIWLYFRASRPERTYLEKLRATLEPYGVRLSISILDLTLGPEPTCTNSTYNNHWVVSKADIV